MALFGAIVAVGLGPALWLGAQFGKFDTDPSRPPAAVSDQHSGNDQLLGGSGAGDNATDEDATTVIPAKPRSHARPLTRSPSAKPSASTSSDPDASASPSASSSSDPSHSAEPSTSPSQSADPSGAPSGAGPSDDPSRSPSASPSDQGGGNGGGDGGGEDDGSTPPLNDGGAA